MKTITPHELFKRLQNGETLAMLDVRTPAEHAEVHVPGVHLMPLDRLDPEELASTLGFAKDKPIFLLCRSGSRAGQAAAKLLNAGYDHCHIVEGGTLAWVDAGLPVNRGIVKVMSLERQVRIAAGAFVLTGVILSSFIHPAFIWLSGFVGAGLIFAGVTDWCGLGMLIAKMPWNQKPTSSSSAR